GNRGFGRRVGAGAHLLWRHERNRVSEVGEPSTEVRRQQRIGCLVGRQVRHDVADAHPDQAVRAALAAISRSKRSAYSAKVSGSAPSSAWTRVRKWPSLSKNASTSSAVAL